MRYLTIPLIGLIFTAPFFILEWFTTSGFTGSDFPFVLFLFMWVNASVFILLLLSVFTDLRVVGGKFNAGWVLLKTVFLVMVLSAWVTILIDQMPCFLGGSGC